MIRIVYWVFGRKEKKNDVKAEEEDEEVEEREEECEYVTEK
jgi:hypothetical protein